MRRLPPQSDLREPGVLPLFKLCLRHCGGGERGWAGCTRSAGRNLRCPEPVGGATDGAATTGQL